MSVIEKGAYRIACEGSVLVEEDTITVSAETQAVVLIVGKTDNTTIVLEEDSVVDIISVVETIAQEEMSEAIEVEHKGARSVSNMQLRGIAHDNSYINLAGNIKIAPSGENVEGYQNIHILLIGDKAKGHALPELEIQNSNVVCSHGSNVGSLEKEELFYLQSRGVGKKEAELILIDAFKKSIEKDIKNISLYEELIGE